MKESCLPCEFFTKIKQLESSTFGQIAPPVRARVAPCQGCPRQLVRVDPMQPSACFPAPGGRRVAPDSPFVVLFSVKEARASNGCVCVAPDRQGLSSSRPEHQMVVLLGVLGLPHVFRIRHYRSAPARIDPASCPHQGCQGPNFRCPPRQENVWLDGSEEASQNALPLLGGGGGGGPLARGGGVGG